jgi:hypothetical protein
MNPFARALAAVVTILALAGAFFFGLFIFAIAIAVGLIAWLVIWLRIWWIRRQLADAGLSPEGMRTPGHGKNEPAEDGGDVIDGEYEVLSRDEDR